MPPLLIDFGHELLIAVGHLLNGSSEYVQHLDVSLGTTEEPCSKFAHEGGRDPTVNESCPLGYPPLEIIVRDVLNQQIVSGQSHRRSPSFHPNVTLLFAAHRHPETPLPAPARTPGH